MFLVSTPGLLRKCFSKELIWNVDTEHKAVFLTFDDGPNPQTTPVILEILDKLQVKATFFCIGKNCERYPLLFDSLNKSGHTIGNHTYSHLNGWKTHTNDYLCDIEKSNKIIASPLFRPPYGRIKPSQTKSLKKKYHIVMWSILSGDFDMNTSHEKCLQNALRYTKPGSIIVFHDSLKAIQKVTTVLPEFIKRTLDQEFSFYPLISE
ncbi:MAG: polysaccharide deacetylase family protein [Bacteroidota bacterium]